MKIWQTIKDGTRIGQKDLLDFMRDRMRLFAFMIMPVFMMIMTGFIFPSQNSLKDIPLGITNQDNGKVGQQIVQVFTDLKLSGGQTAFKIKNYNSTNELKNNIKSQKINGGVVIPSDFSQKIQQNQKVEVIIIPDQSNPQISMILTQIIQGIISGTSTGIAQTKVGEMIKLSGTVNPQLAQIKPEDIVQPIQTQIENLIPGNPNYFQFVAPGIMALIVLMSVMTGLAGSVSREKELGTMDGLLIAPISRLSIILGKTISQAIRGLFQGMIVLLLAILIFGVHIYGSWLIMILLLILGIFAFTGIGILISAVASEQETAMTIMMTIQFPMMFLSGAFFPIQQMPQFMQYISKAIPLTYEITALRKVIILGASYGAVWSEVLILLIFGIVTIAIAVPTFRRVITK